MHKPVVLPPFNHLKDVPALFTFGSNDKNNSDSFIDALVKDFVRTVKQALEFKLAFPHTQVDEFLLHHTWDYRIKQILQLVENLEPKQSKIRVDKDRNPVNARAIETLASSLKNDIESQSNEICLYSSSVLRWENTCKRNVIDACKQLVYQDNSNWFDKLLGISHNLFSSLFPDCQGKVEYYKKLGHDTFHSQAIVLSEHHEFPACPSPDWLPVETAYFSIVPIHVLVVCLKLVAVALSLYTLRSHNIQGFLQSQAEERFISQERGVTRTGRMDSTHDD